MRPKNARWPSTRRRTEPLLPLLCLVALAGPAQAQDPRIPGGGDPAPADTARDEILFLETFLNQQRHPDLVPFRRRDGLFIVSAADLRKLGFALGDDAGTGIVLNALPGVSLRYDGPMQRLWIDAPLSLLSLPMTRIGPGQVEAAVSRSSPGLVFDYDLYASHSRGGGQASLASRVRAFGPGRGVFENSMMNRAIRDHGGTWRMDSVRLDTSVRWSFPGSAVSLVAGDAYTGFLDWTRPVRFGGLQVGRNFALQPYRVTSPLPAFLGEAVVPSTVELYVNGVRQAAQEVPVGPFELTTVPGITGTGMAHIVVTDAFGRVRTLDFPFYSTSRLLARGLGDWSVSVGRVREDYGLRSFSYAHGTVASASLRYGMSDRFTAEAHAETGDGLAMAGAGGAWLAGRAGVVSGAYARSRLDAARGSQSAFSYDWTGGPFHVSFERRRTHGDFRDIASLNGPQPPRASDRFLFGWATGALGSFSLSHVRLEQAGPDGTRSRFAGLFWMRRFRGWSMHASWNRDLEGGADSLYLGAMVPLGDSRHLSASWQRNGERDGFVLDAVRPLPGDGGHGWRAQLRGGALSGGLLEGSWMDERGRLVIGAADQGGGSRGYAQLDGSVVLMGGHLFPGRKIHDAFAVVSTGGVPGVPVKLENRPIGRSGASSMLLVTGLNSWQRNRIAIDPMDLPADLRVDRTEQLVTPADRSGVLVRFAITPVRAAVVVLHDAAGRPLPPGSRVLATGTEEATFVGYDGEAYLEGLEARATLRALTPDGACTAAIDYPDHAAGTIPRIGPVACLPEDR